MSEAKGLAVIAPQNIGEARDLAQALAKASMVPTSFRGNPADVMAVVMAGAELGLMPMQSLRGIVMIDGKPTLSADAMGALVMGRRDVCEWLRCVKTDGEAAEYETQRKGHPEPARFRFTIAEAQSAGLKGKGNWSKYPAAMLRARALSGICRMVYPDVLMGVYDPDEIDVTPMGEAKLEYTPSTAPRASPPQVAEFKESPVDAVIAFAELLAKCATVAEMESAWRKAEKGDHSQQARMTAAYRLRKTELAEAANVEPKP